MTVDDPEVRHLEVKARECILAGFDELIDGINAHAILVVFAALREVTAERDALRVRVAELEHKLPLDEALQSAHEQIEARACMTTADKVSRVG